MATKKKRIGGRLVKKQTGRKRHAAKRAPPKRHSLAARRRATGRQSARKKRASKSATLRRKERKVDEARRHLIEAEKEIAVEELLKHPATTKRGADSHVPSRIKRKRPSNPKEQKLEQGLEESMARSDPVSVTQPAVPIAEKSKNNAALRDDDSALLERALASESQQDLGTAEAQKASELADRTVERLVDKSMPVEEQRRRKRALIKGPKEFRDVREDLPKPKP
jgi:hypothetical protein